MARSLEPARLDERLQGGAACPKSYTEKEENRRLGSPGRGGRPSCRLFVPWFQGEARRREQPLWEDRAQPTPQELSGTLIKLYLKARFSITWANNTHFFLYF